MFQKAIDKIYEYEASGGILLMLSAVTPLFLPTPAWPAVSGFDEFWLVSKRQSAYGHYCYE